MGDLPDPISPFFLGFFTSGLGLDVARQAGRGMTRQGEGWRVRDGRDKARQAGRDMVCIGVTVPGEVGQGGTRQARHDVARRD